MRKASAANHRWGKPEKKEPKDKEKTLFREISGGKRRGARINYVDSVTKEMERMEVGVNSKTERV